MNFPKHSPGTLYCPEAFARGKMMQSDKWAGYLPRGITPSDIDLYFDNDGQLLICEINTHTCRWADLPAGQRRGYESFVKRGLLAVCCQVRLPEPPQNICTFSDVIRFQFMRLELGYIQPSKIFDGSKWPSFVRCWFAGKIPSVIE